MLIATSKGINDIMLDFEEFVAYGCRQLGHKVIQYDRSKKSPNHILETISKVDIAFIPVHGLLRDPGFNNRDFIEKLNNCKCKVVLEVIDEPRIVPAMRENVIPYYRRMIWSHTKKHLAEYKNCEKIISELIIGEHFCYQPQSIEKKYDIVFNGNLYSFRIPFLKTLISKLRKDIDFKILSKFKDIGIDDRYWLNKTDKFFNHPSLNTVYNQSKILLSFGIYADNVDYYSEKDLENIDGVFNRCWGYPCRIFSYMGSGGFTLADQRKEACRYFEEGVEAITYNSIDECIEKIEYYLEHEEEREKIAEAGHKRYLKDHTIETRMKKVLEAIPEK